MSLSGSGARTSSALASASVARVLAVAAGSAAERAGLCAGDEVVAVAGEPLRDVIQYRLATDEAEVTLDVVRGGLELTIDVVKAAGEPLGLDLDAAVFDRVRTCDNHCEFCFIYQLPKGLRRSLYLKDDDYRLSFLYGNFTTLTRFTELDLERVITEGLSPLYVSIHATDPVVRADMLRNPRGAVSLRWLRVLLDHGIEVHGQVVVCPGVNDGVVLEDTLCGILDEYPELAAVALVPLGVSRFNNEIRMRPHTEAEAGAVIDLVEDWQPTFVRAVGHRMVYAADEYYLLAERPFPSAESYEGCPMHEDGVGMVRTFEAEFAGAATSPTGTKAGFFAWSDQGVPSNPAGYRIQGSHGGCATAGQATAVTLTRKIAPDAPIAVLSGTYGARVLGPLLDSLGRSDVRVVEVENRFFGGNIGVSGLMVGEDLVRVLSAEPAGHRYLLPDVCLSDGRFLDGTTVDDLPHPVEIIPTDGIALRRALEANRG